MNNMRRYINVTNKLTEGPAEWAADKLTKASQRVASKVTWGGTKSRLKQLIANRNTAKELLQIWNKKYAAQGYKRLPKDIMNFLKLQLKMSSEEIKVAWDQTPGLINQFGNYTSVTAEHKTEKPGERNPLQKSTGDQKQRIPSGLTAGPADRFESIEEANMFAIDGSDSPSQKKSKLSNDDFRNLLISAIDVKNKAIAQAELEKSSGDPDKPKQDPKDLAKIAAAGGKDMDGDKDYDWKDVAKQAVNRGKGKEALSAMMQAMDPSGELGSLVKSVLKTTSKGR